MKKICCAIAILLLGSWLISSCNGKTSGSKNTLEQVSNFDWILGSWVRSNSSEGFTTSESWSKVSDTLYHGLGITMDSIGDTTFREDMRLLTSNELWLLEVSGVNESPTNFVFTSQNTNSFICENPDNPFPKKIKYWYVEEKLMAAVSDSERTIDFVFEKGE